MNLPNEGASPSSGDPVTGEHRLPRKLGDLQKTITMAQIAKAAGVSQGAISSLLNDRDYGIRVSEKTRERVFKACREMGYLPNDLRAVVRMYPELGEFALLVSSKYTGGLAHPLVARTAAAAMAAIPETSHSLTIAFYDEEVDYHLAADRLPAPITSGTVSKFLFLGTPNQSLLQIALKRGCSMVVLGHDVALAGVFSIVPDFPRASQLAIEYLFKLGHRKLAIISGPFGSTEADIIDLNRGVRLAFDRLGIPIEAQNVVYGDLTAGAGVASLDALFSRNPQPTAVFCVSDTVAAGVIARANSLGIVVPRDLSVIGCADDPAASLLYPPLTTVRLPVEEVARLGIEEVDRLVAEGNIIEPRKTVIPVQLIQRGSCAPLKKS